MKIVVATTNGAKNEAVKIVFQDKYKEFFKEEIEFIAESFPSEVKPQPTSEEEGTNGARRRALNARNAYPYADFFIGMEGYVDTSKKGMFLAGCAVVVNKQGEEGIGYSAKIQVPQFIKNRIDYGEELGPIMQEVNNDPENKIRHKEGTHGVLTLGRYSRIEEFTHALICALAPFVSKNLYEKDMKR